MMLISIIILIGVLSLLKLHITLAKYDFTTYEYIQYMEGHKERVIRLKNNQITKERYEELELKALNKEFK
jgi:hypothetical protein